MKIPVTASGVILPRAWFGDATEVEVRQEDGHVTIVPVERRALVQGQIQPYDRDDPIWQLGKKTSDLAITDASVNLDKYLYGDLGN